MGQIAISRTHSGGFTVRGRFTKKYMTEDYERLRAHSDLLELYLWDTQAGVKPDATEKHTNGKGSVSVQLWRAKSASGGYVVIKEIMPNIWNLDDAVKIFGERATEHTLGIRICLERLTIKRNKIQRGE